MAKRKQSADGRVKEIGDEPVRELKKLIADLGQRHTIWRVFEDFLALSAISLSNTVDLVHAEEREAEYMSIAERYSQPELVKFTEMFACLLMDAEKQKGMPEDTLGRVFHEMELHNKWKGQYFTPQNVCIMMAKMTFGDPKADIERKGYISVSEPSCGSGAMLLGMAQAMRDAGYNYQQHCWVSATDIDLNCARMCYLQLSLHGIPAVVTHGNSITMQTYSQWFTPQFVFGGWAQRLDLERTCGDILNILRDWEPGSVPLQAETPIPQMYYYYYYEQNQDNICNII
jgi:type I restriction-modification system DNA methylase subunit